MMINKIVEQTTTGDILLVTLENNLGFKLVLCSFGASIYKIVYTHTDGNEQLLNLTNENMDEFLYSKSYYGKTIGRVSGRIFGPSVTILDQTYPIEIKDGQTSMLHGGDQGLAFQNFTLISESVSNDAAKITFHYLSPDGEEGFPGNLDIHVSYELNNDNQVVIEYNGFSDQNTLVNLTNHIYFNLSPKFESIDSHLLMINSNEYAHLNDNFQFDEVRFVDQTLFDFRVKQSPSLLSASLRDTKQKGIDNIFLVPKGSNFVAKLEHPHSILGLDVYSTYPGVVIYTHQYPSKQKLVGIDDDGAYKGITFECEYEPLSIQKGQSNSSLLKKNEKYQESIVFQFYRKDK